MPVMVGGVLLDGRAPTEVDPYFYGWRYVTRTGADGAVARERVPLTPWDVLHPQEDDFIIQTDAHDTAVAYLKAVFRHRLRARPGALVLADHRIDWQTGGLVPHGPDIAIFFDARRWPTHIGTYAVRDQGARPVLVVEVTSPSTRDKDLDDKVTDYHTAGVPLYVIADYRPPADADTPTEVRVFAYRSTPEGSVRVRSPEPNRVWLPDLDLWLTAEDDRLVCLEANGTPIGDYSEVTDERDAAELRADAAEARAAAEAAEAQKLRDELAALRARLSAGSDTPST